MAASVPFGPALPRLVCLLSPIGNMDALKDVQARERNQGIEDARPQRNKKPSTSQGLVINWARYTLRFPCSHSCWVSKKSAGSVPADSFEKTHAAFANVGSRETADAHGQYHEPT